MMKTVKIEVQQVEGEGLVSLLGENVVLFCMNYIYAGKLIGVNDTCVLLQNPGVVYETGPFSSASFKDFQPLGVEEHYVMVSAIESFGETKKLSDA